MAKQNVNIFELYVDKITLGVMLLLFLWVFYAFLISSPNKTELSGRMVGPAEIDGNVKGKAEDVLQRVRSARVEPAEVSDYPGDQLQLAQGPLVQKELEIASRLPTSVSFGVPMPDVQGPQAPGQVTLATLLPPEKPAVTIGRLTAYYPPHSVAIGDSLTVEETQLVELEGAQERSWVTVAVHFDERDQRDLFLKHNYQTTKFGVTVTDVFLRRQVRLPSGQWSDWEEIEEYAEYFMDPAPELTLLLDEKNRHYISKSNRDNLHVWFENLVEFHSDLVRPPMPYSEYGAEWYPPYLEELIGLYPDEDWPDPLIVQPKSGKTRKLPLLKRAQQELDTAEQNKEDGKLEVARLGVEKVLGYRKIPPKHRIKEKAFALQAEIKKAIDQRRIDDLKRASENERDAGDEGDFDRPEEIVFAHDHSAEPGSVYRYQVKLQTFNQYATVVERLKDPIDATQIYIESDWSAPSDPVEVPSQQRIFLASAKTESAQFEIYQWHQGRWLKEKFSTKIGEIIGGGRRVLIDRKRTEVKFDTGVRLIGLVEDRPYVPRKKKRNGTVELGEIETSAAAMCQRRDGSTMELIQAAGKTDEERKLIEEAIKIDKRKKRKKAAKEGDDGLRPPGGRGRGRGGG